MHFTPPSFNLPNLRSINQKYFLVAPFIFGLIIIIVSFLASKTPDQSSPIVNSPPTQTVIGSNYEEKQNSITYYITTSQSFLNQARSLAQNNQQTGEDKKKIVKTINQALDLANQAIALYPYDDRGFAQRANIYTALIPFIPSSADLAIQDLKEALKLNRQNTQYHSQLADLYLSREGGESAGRQTIGTQELPLEQASIKGRVIIASEEKQALTETQLSQVSINAKTGQGLIPAGQKEITINNKNVAADKQIVIVPIGSTQNKVLHLVARKDSEWFSVGIDSPISTDIRFDWWIVD